MPTQQHANSRSTADVLGSMPPQHILLLHTCGAHNRCGDCVKRKAAISAVRRCRCQQHEAAQPRAAAHAHRPVPTTHTIKTCVYQYAQVLQLQRLLMSFEENKKRPDMPNKHSGAQKTAHRSWTRRLCCLRGVACDQAACDQDRAMHKRCSSHNCAARQDLVSSSTQPSCPLSLMP